MKRHALFVGVNNYADEDIHQLRFAVNDANELAGFFKHCAKFDRAEALSDPHSCDVVLKQVRDMLDGLGAGDEFLFFFAGHGVTTHDGHRLVCSGDDLASVKHGWAGIPLERLKLVTAGSFSRLFLLDACRSDVLATNRGGVGVMGKGTRDLILDGGGSIGTKGGALTILCSCDDGECAGESTHLRHGLFTKAVLDLLEEKHNKGCALSVDDDFVYRQLPEMMCRLATTSGMDFRQKPQKNGPPVRILDGIVSMNDSHRVAEEQQRMAAIKEREERLAQEERMIREERARQEAERNRLEQQRKRQKESDMCPTGRGGVANDEHSSLNVGKSTKSIVREGPKKDALLYRRTLRGQLELPLEMYQSFGLSRVVLKMFIRGFFGWLGFNIDRVWCIIVLVMLGGVIWLLVYWRHLIQLEGS